MSLVSFLTKPIAWLAARFVGTRKGDALAATVTARLAPTVQADIDAAKPRVITALDALADQLAAETATGKTLDSSVIRPRIHAALASLGLGVTLTAILESEIYTVVIPYGATLAHGAIYALIERVKAVVNTL